MNNGWVVLHHQWSYTCVTCLRSGVPTIFFFQFSSWFVKIKVWTIVSVYKKKINLVHHLSKKSNFIFPNQVSTQIFSTTPKEPYKNNKKKPIKFDPKTTQFKRNKTWVKKKKTKHYYNSQYYYVLSSNQSLKTFKFLRKIMNSEIIVLFYLVPELKLCIRVPISLSFLDSLQFHP
jgi:hypothetical protein